MNLIENIKAESKELYSSFFVNKCETDSLKKITKTYNINDYEVLTDDGFVDIKSLHETIPYEVYQLKLADGKELKCADNHILFVQDYHEETFEPTHLSEIFVKDLKTGSFVMVSDENGNLIESEVLEVVNIGYKEIMYDLELSEYSNRRYYTNGILSHNTELAKTIGEYLFGTKDSVIKLDMSEYMEKHSVSRIIGAPAGYVGYEEGGMLADKVKNNPYCVVLFDEIEKAHPDVLNILLQILDEGKMTDGLGREINFKNTVIIMTSNAGTAEMNVKGKVGFKDENKQVDYTSENIIKNALTKYFRIEFLNRIDEQIIFRKLSKEDVKKIVKIKLNNINDVLYQKKIVLSFADDLVNFIAEYSFDENYGARPILRAISKEIQTPLSQKVLKKEIVDGMNVEVGYDTKEKLVTFSVIENKKEEPETKKEEKKKRASKK
jgi:MoxR-like ATPase